MEQVLENPPQQWEPWKDEVDVDEVAEAVDKDEDECDTVGVTIANYCTPVPRWRSRAPAPSGTWNAGASGTGTSSVPFGARSGSRHGHVHPSMPPPRALG